MDLASAGLKEQPFRTHGRPLSTAAYGAHVNSLAMLKRACELPMGLALLQGPTLSGKTTLLQAFAADVPEDCSVVLVDGTGLGTATLLESLLRKFGFDVDFNSAEELMAMLRVFALQRASAHESPIVILENAHALNPSAYRTLCELAKLRVKANSALKFILVSDRSLLELISAPGMEAVSRRLVADIHLRPMKRDEAAHYLYEKLRAAGSDVPEHIFPAAVCSKLWEASGGWPGILDRVALLALAKADSLPVDLTWIEHAVLPSGTWDDRTAGLSQASSDERPQPPTLYITKNGETVNTIKFDEPRLLIGRSDHNDIPIDSRFVSRHHMLLIRDCSTTMLIDLNSTNGTYVNSRKVSNHMLIHDDVIAVGHHRIKFSDPHARRRGAPDSDGLADTANMKTLDDMRALVAREKTEILPPRPEDVPTHGN